MSAPASVRAAIDAKNKEWMQYFESGDTDSLANKVYTSDCKLCPSNMPEVLGHAAVANVFKSVKGMGIKKAVLTTKEVGGGENGPVYEYGYWEFFTADGNSVDNGKYIVIWKQENGQWLYYIDIFNSNVQK